MSEAVVLADDDPTQFDAAQEPLHERRGAQGGDLPREGDHDHVVQAELIQQPGLLLERREEWRAMIRVDHAPRMGLERDQHAGGTGRARTGDEWLQQSMVAAVDAVKAADRRMARPERAGGGKAEGDRRHPMKTARGWICRVASASPQASSSPSGPRSR